MKGFIKHLTKQVKEREQSAGGKTMRTFAVSDPRFARVKSDIMFEKPEKIKKPKAKETSNPSKDVKPLKKMKNGGKRKK